MNMKSLRNKHRAIFHPVKVARDSDGKRLGKLRGEGRKPYVPLKTWALNEFKLDPKEHSEPTEKVQKLIHG